MPSPGGGVKGVAGRGRGWRREKPELEPASERAAEPAAHAPRTSLTSRTSRAPRRRPPPRPLCPRPTAPPTPAAAAAPTRLPSGPRAGGAAGTFRAQIQKGARPRRPEEPSPSRFHSLLPPPPPPARNAAAAPGRSGENSNNLEGSALYEVG